MTETEKLWVQINTLWGSGEEPLPQEAADILEQAEDLLRDGFLTEAFRLVEAAKAIIEF
jgi:hypothetical protein